MKHLLDFTKHELGMIILLGSIDEIAKAENNQLMEQMENMACVMLQNVREKPESAALVRDQLLDRLDRTEQMLSNLSLILAASDPEPEPEPEEV